MEDYKPNSYKSKNEKREEKKEVKKVVTGNVKTKKKSGLTKFTDLFIQDDIQNVKSYILTDVMIPAGKKLISDIVESILYPGGGAPKRSNASSRVQYTSYNSISTRDRREPVGPRRTYDYNDISYATRADAEAVLMGMDDILEQYQVVSVADLYDLAGVTGTYTDSKYGWTDIRAAHVERGRDGYYIRFPRVMPID